MSENAKEISTSSIAATLAATTAAKAADLATVAATTATALATKTSETTAIISNDLSWMKKSLEGIEVTLKEMSGAFVSTTTFNDNQKMTEDHETRIRGIESNMLKWMGAVSVLTATLSIGVSFLLKLL